MSFNNDDKSFPGRYALTRTAICIILTVSLFPVSYYVGLTWHGFGSGGLRFQKGPGAGHCRKRAGGAPDMEQQLPVAQERPKVEQVFPLHFPLL